MRLCSGKHKIMPTHDVFAYIYTHNTVLMHIGQVVIRAGHRVGRWVPLHVLHAAQDSLPGAGVRARQAIQGASQEGRRSGDRQVSIGIF
jgi:hypothetical protein